MSGPRASRTAVATCRPALHGGASPPTYDAASAGYVCRVSGKPADDPCVNTPPADAYWGLFWSDGVGELVPTPPRAHEPVTSRTAGTPGSPWQGSDTRRAPDQPAAHPSPSPSHAPTHSPGRTHRRTHRRTHPTGPGSSAPTGAPSTTGLRRRRPPPRRPRRRDRKARPGNRGAGGKQRPPGEGRPRTRRPRAVPATATPDSSSGAGHPDLPGAGRPCRRWAARLGGPGGRAARRRGVVAVVHCRRRAPVSSERLPR